MKRLTLILCFLWGLAFADDRISLVLVDVRLADLVRVVHGEIAREPFMLSPEILEAQERYTVDLRGVSKSSAIASVAALVKSAGFEATKRAGVVWIGKPQAADDELIVYRPRHRSSRYLADVVQSVTGARSVLSRSVKSEPALVQPSREPQQTSAQSVQSQAQRQSSPTSVEGQIDRSEVDQIAFNVAARDSAKVRKLLADLDTPSGEVLLKAAVYEVGVDKREGSALQIAVNLMSVKLIGKIAGNVLSGASIKFAGEGLEAVLSAVDADARFKSVSRPQVRVRNGAQARFSVGQDVPVLGSAQLDKSGNVVQSVEYKQSGVILSATPEIREDVIEVNLSQELSNFVVTKTGVNGSPTLIKRSVNTKLGMVPGEVVILAGLQDDQEDESDNRLPWLGWLVGQDRAKKRSEILVFLEVERI